jgi:phage tail tape-measure protein
MSDSQKEQNAQTGGLAGLGAGVLAGAAAGTAVMPVVGTFAGAMVGGLLGNEVGKTFGGAILDVITIPPESVSSPTPSQEQGGSQDVLSQLERLGALKSQGLITEEEFKAAKARILS